MNNTDILITAMVLSAVSEYQRRKELREIAIREGHQRMATTCSQFMEHEIEWLKHSGYPEVIGLSGEFIARKIEGIEVPDDFVEAMSTMILFEDDEPEDEFEFDFEEYDEDCEDPEDDYWFDEEEDEYDDD